MAGTGPPYFTGRQRHPVRRWATPTAAATLARHSSPSKLPIGHSTTYAAGAELLSAFFPDLRGQFDQLAADDGPMATRVIRKPAASRDDRKDGGPEQALL